MRSFTRYAKPALAIFLGLLAASWSSCRKDTLHRNPPAVVQVYNTMGDGTSFYVNLAPGHSIVYAFAMRLNNQRNGQLTFPDNERFMSVYANPDTLSADPPAWHSELELQPGGMYSLFFTGEKNTVNGLLVKDILPVPASRDSVTYFRFANMSSTAKVDVYLKGESAPMVPGLAFRSLSEFFRFTADASAPDYEFEFRDAETGEVLVASVQTGVGEYPNFNNTYLQNHATVLLSGGTTAVPLRAGTFFYR